MGKLRRAAAVELDLTNLCWVGWKTAVSTWNTWKFPFNSFGNFGWFHPWRLTIEKKSGFSFNESQ
jgi:hypothetical protein